MQYIQNEDVSKGTSSFCFQPRAILLIARCNRIKPLHRLFDSLLYPMRKLQEGIDKHQSTLLLQDT